MATLKSPSASQRKSAPKPTQIDRVTWDDVVPELGLRHRNGTETWLVQLREAGDVVRKGLGKACDLTRDAARSLACAWLNARKANALPHDPKIRLHAFLKIYLADCREQWKASTFESHGTSIRAHILPGLGQEKVCDLTSDAVIAWLGKLTQSAGTRNRALAILSGAMRHAELLGLRSPGSNPCEGLRRRQSSFVAEYLDSQGFFALDAALRAEEPSHGVAVAFIRFLALTGCRRGEAEAATWEMLEGKRLALPDSKSGPRTIWLGKPARDLLARMPKGQGPIFAGPKLSIFQKEVDQLWYRIRLSLGRPNLRLHDLRHSFASVAGNHGFSLQVIGGLLGHADQMTTAGYAHLDENRLQAASQRVGQHFDRVTENKPKIQTACVYRAFDNSSQPLTKFCADRGLDPDKFRRELITWRKEEARA